MKREDRKKFENTSLFTFDEMLNSKLDRWEVSTLNGRNGPALVYSLIIDMFRYIGDTRPEDQILTECCTTENWYQKYTWTTIQHNKWREEHLIPVIMKRMRIPKYRAERESSWFMLQWSFKVED